MAGDHPYEKLIPLAQNLSDCTNTSVTYTDPNNGAVITKTISKNGESCTYTETIPTHGLLSCDLSLELASKMSTYYIDINKYVIAPDKSSLKEPVLTIDGETILNPIQHALDKKLCSFEAEAAPKTAE